MASLVPSIAKGMRDTWGRLGKSQRAVVLGAAILVFLGTVAAFVVASRGPAYDVLWSNLDPADGGAIIKELERQSIPYKITDGGRTIKIPADMVYKVRLSLASQGLPSSGIVGFESMGSNSIWTTDFERKVQYVRALSGELARTIKSISGIEDARVHIVLPEPSVFVSQRRPATAAVLLKLRPMQELAPATVRGIVNLVARSVEGLSPDQVTVVDSNGRLLSQDYIDASGGAGQVSSAVYELTSKVEKDLEKRLLAMLSPVLGPGNVVCQVKAELNMDQVKVTDKVVTSDPQGAIVSSQEIRETYQGTGSAPGGPAGGLDVPSYATTGSGQSQYERQETIRNFEVNERVTETTVTPGSIKRLSVAVVVNKQLGDEEKEAISRTVSVALGLDPGRQDSVSVTGIPFDNSLSKQIDAITSTPSAKIPKIYIYAIAVGAAIVVGTIVLLFARRRKEPAQVETAASKPAPEPVEPIELSPELLFRQKTRETVEKLARTNPEIVAAAIKSWLLEDER